MGYGQKILVFFPETNYRSMGFLSMRFVTYIARDPLSSVVCMAHGNPACFRTRAANVLVARHEPPSPPSGSASARPHTHLVSPRRATTHHEPTGHHSFDIVFNSHLWDWYIVIKHVSEWMILFIMLWILHDPREDASVEGPADSTRAVAGAQGGEYWEIPAEAEEIGGRVGRGSSSHPASQLTGNGRRLDEYGAI